MPVPFVEIGHNQIGTFIYNEAGARNEDEQKANEATLALRRGYLNDLYNKVSRLEFSGSADSSGKGQLTLDQVYTALLTSEVEIPKMSQGQLVVGDPTQETRKFSAVEQLNRHTKLVLLGSPGSGKSAFVNFVALCMAGELLGDKAARLGTLTTPLPTEGDNKQKPIPQPWDHGALLPVRVILRNVAANHLPPVGEAANANHLLDYLECALDDAALSEYFAAFKSELRQRGGLILLDGLDEVPEADERRVQIKQMVESFVALFPKCRYLVTSRTYAYQNEAWELTDFEDATLEVLQPAQIHAFVRGWYTRIAPLRSLTEADAQARAELLNQSIDQNERLVPLAEQPLLLTLMTNLHAFRGGSLPEKREQLYAAAVDLLLDWWERQRVVYDEGQRFRVVQPSLLEYLKVGKERILAALGELAFTVHKSNPSPDQSAIIRQGELIDALMNVSPDPNLQPRQLIDYLSVRTGLLLAEGNRIFKFPHRTFQEYLAARHLTGASYPDEVAELARHAPNRWREVLLLAAAHAAAGTESPAWEVAEALFPSELAAEAYQTEDYWCAHLAGQVLKENINLAQLRPRNQAKVARIRQGLLQVMRNSLLPALERAHAGRTLAWLGDPRPEVMTIAGMQFCYVPPGEFYFGEENELVNIDYGYWVGRYPVTNAQFAEFMQAGGYQTERYWAEAIKENYWSPQGFKGRYDNKPRTAPYEWDIPFSLPNHPVVGITWYESVAFCGWLSEQVNSSTSAKSGRWQVRLPLTDEWEKSARGGNEIPNMALTSELSTQQWLLAQPPDLKTNREAKRRYPAGDDFGLELANYSETGIDSTSSVGCFERGASPYGVEELSGNVWEWLQQEPGDLAGGACWNDKVDVTTSARVDSYPAYRSNLFGFRCVVVPISLVLGSGS